MLRAWRERDVEKKRELFLVVLTWEGLVNTVEKVMYGVTF